MWRVLSPFCSGKCSCSRCAQVLWRAQDAASRSAFEDLAELDRLRLRGGAEPQGGGSEASAGFGEPYTESEGGVRERANPTV